jgi:hypothetical protein
MEEWFVFSKDASAGRHGLLRSKRGIFFKKVDNKDAATALRKQLGPGSWTASLAQLCTKARRHPEHQLYQPASGSVLAARESERLRALADFAADRDWPPWEDPPQAKARFEPPKLKTRSRKRRSTSIQRRPAADHGDPLPSDRVDDLWPIP